MTLDRYKQNLRIEGDNVYSYKTHVATIDNKYLRVKKWYSMTTTKHVNYVARELNLTICQDENRN